MYLKIESEDMQMNSEYAILCNMFYQGSVRHENMATLKTQNFIIDIQREEVEKTFLDLQYNYRCILIFKDLLGREIRRLVFNEADAMILTDNISTFVFNDYTEMIVLSNIIGPTIFESYSISLKATEVNGDYSVLLQVLCYNSATQIMQPVISTILSLEELDNLCDMMFFIYLIDLAAEREGIYKV